MLSKELGNYRHALTDAEEAIRLRNTNVKVVLILEHVLVLSWDLFAKFE